MCLVYILYLAYFYALGSEDVILRIYIFVLNAIALVCTIAMYIMYSKVYSTNLYTALRFIINVGSIQVAFVLLSLINGSFRDWVISTSRLSNLEEISSSLGVRTFGLANGYTSTLPMLMGILAIISIYMFANNLSLKAKLFYLLITLGFITGIVLNARIGIVPLLVFIIIAPLYFLYNKKLLSFVSISITAFILIPFLFLHFNILNSEFFIRFNEGIIEFQNLLSGRKSGTFLALERMWFFPEDIITLLFGSGENIFGGKYKSSDIAFIQDIYMYGLIPTIFLFLYLSYFYYPLITELKAKFGLSFIIILSISLVSFYFKGMGVNPNEVLNTLLFLAIISIINGKMRTYNIKNYEVI